MNDERRRTEGSPLLLTFGDQLAPRISNLIRLRPSLLKRLILANRSAHHCLVSYMHLGPDIGLPDAELAGIVEETSPRCLLRFAIEDPSPRMYRILNRAGDRGQDANYYIRLDKLLKSPMQSMISDNDAEELTPVRLTYYEDVLRLDPIISALPKLRVAAKHKLQAADTVMQYLRGVNILNDEDLTMPEQTGMKSFRRRLHRALARIESPLPKFELPAPLHFVSTIGELQSYGRRFQNCLGKIGAGGEDRLLRLGAGTSMFIVSEEPTPMIAEVRLASGNVWFMSEARGVKNEYIDEAGKLPILNMLRDAGFNVLSDDPASALQTFSFDYRSNRRGGFDFDDEDLAA